MVLPPALVSPERSIILYCSGWHLSMWPLSRPVDVPRSSMSIRPHGGSPAVKLSRQVHLLTARSDLPLFSVTYLTSCGAVKHTRKPDALRDAASAFFCRTSSLVRGTGASSPASGSSSVACESSSTGAGAGGLAARCAAWYSDIIVSAIQRPSSSL